VRTRSANAALAMALLTLLTLSNAAAAAANVEQKKYGEKTTCCYDCTRDLNKLLKSRACMVYA
jgi:uncharacterized membrane protein